VDSKAEYSALSSTRRQKKKLKQTMLMPSSVAKPGLPAKLCSCKYRRNAWSVAMPVLPNAAVTYFGPKSPAACHWTCS